MNSPVVMFAYNRPEHTRAALITLRANQEASNTELFVYCDGPPAGCPQALTDSIEETRRVVRETEWCGHVEVIEADSNLGCDVSMRAGITEIIESFGKAIIFEDDLRVGPHWLSFVNRGLELYEEDERVGAISGFMYPVRHRKLPKTFFSCLLNFWGWGTWKRAWSCFETDAAELLHKLNENSLIERFMLGRPEYLDYLIALQNREDSYDILWYATLLTRKQLVLYPGQSLVANLGFDSSGTHLSILDGPNYAFLNQTVAPNAPQIIKEVPFEDVDATLAVVEANGYIWPPIACS